VSEELPVYLLLFLKEGFALFEKSAQKLFMRLRPAMVGFSGGLRFLKKARKNFL